MRISKLISGLGLGSFLLVSFGVLGFSQAKGPDAKAMKNPVRSSPQSIDAGKEAYQKNCVPCHGASGKGDGTVAANLTVKPSDLTSTSLKHGNSDGEIFTNIKEGIPPDMKMKAFKAKLSDTDIWNIVNYIRSLQGKK